MNIFDFDTTRDSRTASYSEYLGISKDRFHEIMRACMESLWEQMHIRTRKIVDLKEMTQYVIKKTEIKGDKEYLFVGFCIGHIASILLLQQNDYEQPEKKKS